MVQFPSENVDNSVTYIALQLMKALWQGKIVLRCTSEKIYTYGQEDENGYSIMFDYQYL